MKNWITLALFWPRMIAEMVAAVLKKMPLTIKAQQDVIEQLKIRNKALEDELMNARLELDRRRPGGFRRIAKQPE